MDSGRWLGFRRGDLLLIEWDDAHAISDEWTFDSELDDADIPCVVQSTGFFVKTALNQVILCADMTDGGDGLLLNTVYAIPTGCVRTVTLLRSTTVG